MEITPTYVATSAEVAKGLTLSYILITPRGNFYK